MIEGKKILAIIPARSGSKGVPGKNLRKVMGKPLLAYTIEEANKSDYIDRLIISSDDRNIISVAEKYGAEAPFVRPSHMAQDSSPVVDAIKHALDELPGYDYILLLQPTSPLRLSEDIDACIRKTVLSNAKACISVTKPENSPYWMFRLDAKDRIYPMLESDYTESRRQDLPVAYIPNGALYLSKAEWFLKSMCFVSDDTIAFVMPNERSLDIDSEIDFQTLENALMKRLNEERN